MDVTSLIPAALGNLVTQSELLILYLVGIVIALFTWARHPRTSLFTIIALGGLLVLAVANVFVYSFLPAYFIQVGGSVTNATTVYAIINLVFNLLHAVAFGLLLAAIFGERANKLSA